LLDINVNNIQIDAMTISSHKLHGPKGAGALYIRRGVKIAPLIIGGSQEHNRRAGTINTPAIVGFGVAISIAKRDLDVNVEKITKLRNYFINRILTEIEDTSLNGHPNQRLANNISITFNNINGEALLIMLDMAGIAVSTGSACSVGSTELPYTLLALKLTLEQAKSTIRFSLDVSTSKEEIDYTMEKLIVCVKKLRTISPLVKIKGGK
ncbi:MAG: aminotransferase class V-fold PLP-dependent enzyme, partial [Clostridia bacterium]